MMRGDVAGLYATCLLHAGLPKAYTQEVGRASDVAVDVVPRARARRAGGNTYEHDERDGAG